MRNRFPGKSCVLCSSPSVGRGEHVWSHWLLGEFNGEGPFRTEKSGVAYENRDHEVVTFSGVQGVHVPMCHCHNTKVLKELVEDPAAPVMRRVLRSDKGTLPTLDPDEAAALGRWFLKVGLLLAHPEAVHDNPHVRRSASPAGRIDYSSEWIQWMADGVDPSEDFSVYVTRAAPTGDGSGDGTGDASSEATILLPGHVVVDGHELPFMCRQLGVRDLYATIVFHPGWPILHPLVEAGQAQLLWPPPGAPVDLDALTPICSRQLRFVVDAGSIVADAAQYARITATPLQVDLFPAFALTADASE